MCYMRSHSKHLWYFLPKYAQTNWWCCSFLDQHYVSLFVYDFNLFMYSCTNSLLFKVDRSRDYVGSGRWTLSSFSIAWFLSMSLEFWSFLSFSSVSDTNFQVADLLVSEIWEEHLFASHYADIILYSVGIKYNKKCTSFWFSNPLLKLYLYCCVPHSFLGRVLASEVQGHHV